MVTLNILEQKYLEFKLGVITIFDFEQWVYTHEDEIISASSESMYEDLIILNYNTRHSKSMLSKTISADYEKLEHHQLQEILIKLLDSEKFKITNAIIPGKYSHYDDPHYRISLRLEINNIMFRLHNPFVFEKDLWDLNNEDRSKLLISKFTHPRRFIKTLKESLETSNLRLVVAEFLNSGYYNNYTEYVSGTKDDLVISIDKHRFIINKKYLITKMNGYWL